MDKKEMDALKKKREKEIKNSNIIQK